MNDQFSIVTASEEGDSGEFQRIAQDNELAPGYYWRLKADLKVPVPGWSDHSLTLRTGDIHLLLDVFEYDGAPHTVTVLSHPRRGASEEYKILIQDFLANFEPAHDAEAVRAAEQAELMLQISAMQEEMATVQTNPQALPDYASAVEKAVESFEQKMVAETTATQKDASARQSDLRKIHRRAARRSAAAGNPLTIKTVTVSDKVDLMIAGGVNSEGLQEMTYEAKKHIAIAEATAEWLTKRTEAIASTLKALTPYYAEKGKVALARAKKAINYVKDVTKGLASLKLYTGDGVEVLPVTDGNSAPTKEPLTLIQGKRYMDEELAVWAEVDDTFDWRSQHQFFNALKANPALVDQVMPAPRCVVSVAVTRRTVQYDRQMSAFERVMNEIRNKEVFLLVRDGQNVSAVYSSEPSHETTPRLFPTVNDLKAPFLGIDGTSIRLQDVAFGDAKGKFEDWALHYKRMLILLCGLDHRLKLMGDFYPAGEGMQFMSLEFQSRYFRFVADEEASTLLDSGLEPVGQWISRCNKAVRSGSRVVISSKGGIKSACPQLERLYDAKVDENRLPAQLVVSRTKGHHSVTVPLAAKRNGDDLGSANAWLDGPDAPRSSDWFLCMDLVRIEAVRRYIASRESRAQGIGWIRTFKRVVAILEQEHATQATLRAHLAAAALDNGILSAEEVPEAMEAAIATWRAAKRGVDAPEVTETKAVHDLLTLMFPSDRLAQSSESLLKALIQELGTAPLMLTRSGKTRLVLYVETNANDRAPYGTGLHWGWVKRVLIDVLKTKLSVASSSLVWLEKGKPNPAEETVREWPLLQSWVQTSPEPCRLGAVEQFRTEMQTLAAALGETLANGRAAPTHSGLDEALLSRMISDCEAIYAAAKTFQHMYLFMPVGIVQPNAGGAIRFLYAKADAAQFVHRYGTAEQWAVFKRMVFPGVSRVDSRALDGGFAWSLQQSSEPAKKLVLNHYCLNMQTPTDTSVESHKAGGLTKKRRKHMFYGSQMTRAERRAANGAPYHERETHLLSWNRRFQTILGLAPHLRAEYYKRGQRHPFNRVEETPKAYVRPSPLHDLSSLVWDPTAGRSLANRYFSIPREK